MIISRARTSQDWKIDPVILVRTGASRLTADPSTRTEVLGRDAKCQMPSAPYRLAPGILLMESPSQIRQFEVLFDHAEPSPFADEGYAPYGNFGFPAPPAGRPWIYSNFVQSLDGITTL